MKEHYSEHDKDGKLRDKIIGLGESSLRKSYYPELRERLSDLERFRTLVDHSNDAIFLIEVPSGRFLDVSESACRQIGYSKNECSAMMIKDVLPDNRDMLDRVLSGKAESLIFEGSILKRDGKRTPCEVNMHRQRFGGRDYVIAVARDISERKRYEESLKLTQFALDKFSDSTIWVSPEGRIVYVNDTASRWLGYSREDLLSMHIWDIDPDYGTAGYREIWDKLKRMGGTLKFESRHVTRNGRVFPVEITASYIRYGRKEYLISIDRDITDRKRAEAALYESEQRFRQLVDSSPLPTGWYDASKKIEYLNKKFVRTFGYTLDDIPYLREWWPLAYPDAVYRQEVIRQWTERTEKAEAGSQEIEPMEAMVTCKDGSVRYVHFSGAIIGNVTLLILQDVTERRRAEEALKAAKNEAELYMDLMGHDINNINQIAIGFLEIANEKLQTTGRLEAQDSGLIATPLESLENGARLIRNLRKIQTEKTHAYAEELIDVDRMLENVIKQYSHVPGRDISIEYRPAHKCQVYANPLLRDVFVNLLDNAVRHSHGPLTIGIYTSVTRDENHEYCRIAIEDNGPGIPDYRKAMLFDFSLALRQKIAGKGLGLYLVKTLIDDFHGKVLAEDRVPGDHTQGSRFIVLLPLAREHEQGRGVAGFPADHR